MPRCQKLHVNLKKQYEIVGLDTMDLDPRRKHWGHFYRIVDMSHRNNTVLLYRRGEFRTVSVSTLKKHFYTYPRGRGRPQKAAQNFSRTKERIKRTGVL